MAIFNKWLHNIVSRAPATSRMKLVDRSAWPIAVNPIGQLAFAVGGAKWSLWLSP